MKRKIRLLILATVALAGNATAQTNPLIKYLPDDASTIISFNPIRLAGKIPGETFRQSFMYREMMKKDDAEMKAFFSDPSVSGVDFSNDLMLTVAMDTASHSFQPTIHVFGTLKNEALFSLVMNKVKRPDDSLHLYGNTKILFKDHGTPTMAWNNEVFVMNIGMSSKAKIEMLKVFSDTTAATGTDYEKRINEAMANVSRIQREECFDLLTPHPGNAMTGNSAFINIMNSPGDMKMWSNGTSPSPVLGKGNPLTSIMGSFKQFSGNDRTSVISFENGKIVSTGRTYVNSTIADIYKRYPVSAQNTDLTRRLPKGKLLGLMNLSFNADMGKELLQKSGFSAFIDSLKGHLPIDPSVMTNVFGNNFMLAVVQSDDISQSDSITQKMGGVQVILATSIADKARFDLMKNYVLHFWDSLSNGEDGSKTFKGFNPSVKNDDKLMVLSLSPATASAFLSDPGTGPVPAWLETYSSHPMVVSLNLHDLLSMVLGKLPSGNNGEEKKLLDMFDQVLIYGGEYENGCIVSNIEFKFTNQSDNALKQLFDIINMMADKNEGGIMNNRGTSRVEEVTIEDVKISDSNLPPPPPPPPAELKKVKVQPAKKTKD